MNTASNYCSIVPGASAWNTVTRSDAKAVTNLTLSGAVDAGIAYALSLIRSRYERDSDPDNNLPFHCAAHTAGVIRRTGALLHAMDATENERRLGLLAAAFHDTVQRWVPLPFSDGRVMRGRCTGQNEADSAAEAVFWMLQRGRKDFDEQKGHLVTQAILATVPGWDTANATVSQPNLTPNAPVVVRAVALADLGIAGMEAAAFVETGDQLFREDNLDIARSLRLSARHPRPSADTLESYRARMLTWSSSQTAFARGRCARLEIELGNLGSRAKAAVRSVFSSFDAALADANEVLKARERLSPWELARSMGYPIPVVAGLNA